MNPEPARIEHLKLIQGVINRMAQFSFIIKGWTITLVIAILGFAVSISNGWISLITLVPLLTFWGLDAYYLRLERMFRMLHDNIRTNNITSDNFFSMDVNLYRSKVSWWQTLKRPAVLWLYLPTVTIVLIISIVIFITK